MSDSPNEPIDLQLEADREYWWCACGRTKTNPWCDGSHEGTDKRPVSFKVEQPGSYSICRCHATQTPPFCDGSHERL